MSNTRYKIEEADGGFVLIEERSLFGNTPGVISRVPYSIAQEAESGTEAASHTSDALQMLRRSLALDLVRSVAADFIEKDPTAASLLKIRKKVESLITASIAELRKGNSANHVSKVGA